MSDAHSELIALAKLNGDFRKNYGPIIGALIYLRSISAARGRSLLWSGVLGVIFSVAATWLEQHGFAWLHSL